MYDVDRSVIILVPKVPFWNWLKSLPELDLENLDLQDLQNDPNSYLISPCENIEDAWKLVAENVEGILKTELSNWTNNEKYYPQLDINTLKEWFELLLSTMVTDVMFDDIDRKELSFCAE